MAYGKLEILGGDWVLRTPYDPQRLPRIKALPGARWDKDRKVWRVSSEPRDLDTLLAALTALDIAVPEEITARAAAAVRAAVQAAPARADDPRLYRFQRDGVIFLANHVRALLGDEQGTGKTVEILMALPDSARVIVVCPSSLKRNWAREAATWRPDLKATVLSGRTSFRWPGPGELITINYDILPAEVPEGVPQGIVLVIDECQFAKNSKTSRTKRLRALGKAVRGAGGRTWLATGTPLLNRPPELWGVLESGGMAEEVFDKWPRFYGLFNAQKTRFGTEWGEARPQVPALLARVMLRRTRATVLPDLPQKRHQLLEVNGLDATTKKICDEALRAWDEAGDPRVLPPFEEMSRARAALARAKIPALLELVEQYEDAEEPLVVFSDHLDPIRELATREGWATITGETPADDRARIVADFQAGKLRGIGLTITAGGTGITLTRAHNMLLVDLNWVPANNLQAEDRIMRIGQANACLYRILVAEHALDERIQQVIGDKMRLIEGTIHETPQHSEDAVLEAIEKQKALRAEASEEATKERVDLEELLAQGKARRCFKCGAILPILTVKKDGPNRGRPFTSCRGCNRFSWEDQTGVSDEYREWILRAARVLAAVCDGAVSKDGQGFNGADTGFGHWLATLDSVADDSLAHRAGGMLVTYQKQLEDMGLWPHPKIEPEKEVEA